MEGKALSLGASARLLFLFFNRSVPFSFRNGKRKGKEARDRKKAKGKEYPHDSRQALIGIVCLFLFLIFPLLLSLYIFLSYSLFPTSFALSFHFIPLLHGGCQVNGPKVAKFLDR